MNDVVPTIKVTHKNDEKKTVYTINMSDYNKGKHDLATGDDVGPLKPLDPSQKESLYGSSIQPATWAVDGKTVQLGTIVAQAHQESGLTSEQWNALPQDEREDKIQAVVDKVIPAPEPYTVGKKGRGAATKFFLIDTNTGKPVDEEEFPTEAAAQNKITELLKAKA